MKYFFHEQEYKALSFPGNSQKRLCTGVISDHLPTEVPCMPENREGTAEDNPLSKRAARLQTSGNDVLRV